VPASQLPARALCPLFRATMSTIAWWYYGSVLVVMLLAFARGFRPCDYHDFCKFLGASLLWPITLLVEYRNAR
jgi:hypothetical protein